VSGHAGCSRHARLAVQPAHRGLGRTGWHSVRVRRLRQARVHRFSADGRLLGSWGEAGQGRGQFTLPHHVSGDRKGSIFVCDRESEARAALRTERRVRGRALRPLLARAPVAGTRRASTPRALLWWQRRASGEHSGGAPPIRSPRSSRRREALELLARWGDLGSEPGQFLDCPHGLCLDSAGSIYVTEVRTRRTGSRSSSESSGAAADRPRGPRVPSVRGPCPMGAVRAHPARRLDALRARVSIAMLRVL